jgi:hypothetical protein
MLDNDQLHPANILEQLAGQTTDLGVVGALYHQRGDNYKPCFFIYEDPDKWITLQNWPDNTLLQCAFVGTGAIMIRRWVFDKLEEKGFKPPFFRFDYTEPNYPTEDWYFANLCRQAGINHWVHTGLPSPHLGWRAITTADWQRWVEANPQEFEEVG